MSDNARRYWAIYNGLKKLCPTDPKGNYRRHLNTLALIISGIVGSKRSNLPEIAAKVADLRKPESRVKSFSRLLKNERIDYETYYLPYATGLIRSLMGQPLKLIFDGSEVGRNCVTLMACVIYKGRALPICWITKQGKKGHFSQELHLELLKQLRAMIPEHADVIFLGDGEFDGMDLIKQISEYGWYYVCRTAINRVFEENGEPFSLRNMDVHKDGYLSLPKVYYSNEAYGPFHVIVWWEKTYDEPIYLITNLELPQEAFYWYKKRFYIETFFSDKKSRGFHLHKSHISDPDRIKRLMIATCLAYIWIVFLGALAMENGWNKIIHRTDRCDLSLFKLGLRVLDDLLNMMKNIPVAFQMDLFDQFEKSVR